MPSALFFLNNIAAKITQIHLHNSSNAERLIFLNNILT